jgi:hypothetical protein
MRRTEYFPFKGGLNTEEPALSIEAGELINARNYEVAVSGGYRRIDGYERFDGHPKPSDLNRYEYDTESAWITALEARRSAIGAVPGEGDILGVWHYDDTVYAFRNKTGGMSAGMYKSTASGWVEVDLGRILLFKDGSSEFTEGDTLTGGTSGATGTVGASVLVSGDWSSNDAAGYVILASVTGTFEDGEVITDGPGGSAKADGADSAQTLNPNGQYEFINFNFGGHTDTRKMYGVSGVDKAFEYNGAVYVPITTGMDDDTPTHLVEHRNYLWLSFSGGSVQYSPLGAPRDKWTALLGAGEIAIGAEIVGFSDVPGDSLAVFSRNSIDLLAGDPAGEFQRTTYSAEAGAIRGTIQRLNFPLFTNDSGLMEFRATEAYGDFQSGTLSQKVKSVMDAKRGLESASIVAKGKDQYRIFYSDGSGLVVTFNGTKVSGIMPIEYPVPVLCACNGTTSTGEEVIFFGSDTGYVYQMDAGSSFDGAEVEAWIRPSFYHFKRPEQHKRFYKIVLEIDARINSALTFLPVLDYAEGSSPDALDSSMSVFGSGGAWDEALWDEFFYDSPLISSAYGYFDAIGRNLSPFIRSNHTYEEPHTVQGAIIHYSIRGLKR